MAIGGEHGITYDASMVRPQIVMDTNLVIVALRSQRGASFQLLSLVGSGTFEANMSVPLVLEYEEVLQRELSVLTLAVDDVDDLLDYLCMVANRHQIHFLWWPLLKDPKDDMVLELAVVADCDYIVTYNQRDFQGAETFGVKVIEPVQLLLTNIFS